MMIFRRGDKADLARQLRDTSQTLKLENTRLDGFKAEIVFSNEQVDFKHATYKDRWFELILDKTGNIRFVLNGPGGGEMKFPAMDDMAFRHKVENSRQGEEQRLELAIWIAKRVQEEIFSPSSWLGLDLNQRKRILRWFEKLSLAIEHSRIR